MVGEEIRRTPGHDAWVVGEEPCIMLDFSGADEFAQEAK
jgi:hypothetical protein